jgi:murein tripeptide amidase MpaA
MRFNHYYDYDELTKTLKAMVEKKPNLANLISIGKSPEKRHIWIVELTNKNTGDPGKKPAIWIDGNTHAGEVTGSIVCLKTIYYLLNYYSLDRDVSRLLDDFTFYVLPRIDPDGGEFVLKTPYYVLRGESETGGGRWYPFSEEDWKSTQRGLYMEAADGDGFITSMRVPEPNGDWKISSQDERLMIRREPRDIEGNFYRIYPEGLILNYLGEKSIEMAPQRWSLNFNRNYPGSWGREDTDRGSGPYPLSEPETRSVVDFIISHPNICLAITYHTHGGVCLSYSENENLHPQDRNLFSIIESIFSEVTGYPSFSMRSGRAPGGSFSSYLSLYQDIPCVTIELWDVLARAGLGDWVERGRFATSKIKEEERDLKLLAWNDEKLNGKGFVNWREYNHPQLGKVEIGGWDKKFITRNPPIEFLEDEIDNVLKFPLICSEILPRLEFSDVHIKKIDNSLVEVKCIVQNKGAIPSYIMKSAHFKKIDNSLVEVNVIIQNKGAIPSYIMKSAQEAKINRISLSIELSDDLILVDGKKYQEFNLEGYAYSKITKIRSQRKITGDKYKKEFRWLIRKNEKGKITFDLSSNKGGTIKKIVQI